MAEPLESSALAEITAEIVSAYVSHNQISPLDLSNLISAVAGQLGKLGTEVEQPAAPSKPEPAVPVRRSIRPDHLVCLVCGKTQTLLKRHLAAHHGLTPAQYRETFDLKADYPMVAPRYAQQRRELALEIGLGRPKKRRRRRSTARPKAAPKPSHPALAEASS